MSNPPHQQEYMKETPPKAPWGLEYYYDDVVCDWGIRLAWWTRFIPKPLLKKLISIFNKR